MTSSDTLDVECPKCHEFVTLKKSSGTYSGKCIRCKPNVTFSLVVIDRISQKGRDKGAKDKVKRKEVK